MSETATPEDRLIDAALIHVAFDGWSDATLRAAARDAGVDLSEARALFPRGGVDMALAFHRRGDAEMERRLRREPLDDLKVREKIIRAVRTRIEAIEDKEAARRATSLFALPQHAAAGSRAIWDTADLIWTVLGDPSDDINWYTKRATLSGVYGSTVLYWLGDESLENQATWSFLERRIEDVMRFEKAKASVNANPVMRTLLAGPNWALSRVRPPRRMPKVDMPGSWNSES
ncbi:ubiquinone biosynthesis protein COQ9 [Tranquillimonas rosea]|uniref:Ubiquinone biosynthesis protein COQ9 n=1 Tax=Tranquillimonas rosea TaxID=641238 RepID=A0A1H9R902_9RHOB|nr:COQ9 family protein [Tranquillimonas rosea]SER69087.1 ubiquinone biosynthesis protein COQ9 [Tranquillimonas rosea]